MNSGSRANVHEREAASYETYSVSLTPPSGARETPVYVETNRLPSGVRTDITIPSRAIAICSSIRSLDKSMPYRASSVRRTTASWALPACSVVNDPSWPVLMASSMSIASRLRTSPTTIRSGRMRRAFTSKSWMLTAPSPSMDASRASSRTTWGWCVNLSSAESSMVTIRSPCGISQESAFKSVVLPDPVPPATAKS